MDVYKITREFPREELYGLTSQIRRAAVSVVANIVEGCARTGEKELAYFLNIAFGSLRETGYYITLSVRLGYLHPDHAKPLTEKYDETARVLNGLLRSVQPMQTHTSTLKTQESRLSN